MKIGIKFWTSLMLKTDSDLITTSLINPFTRITGGK
jgi:hypothetical protein